ncbi:sigma-70 family RNA polymerase sigma factor [Lacihabitans sp. LS3-19]|uniref:RNA polymerase sigma factor n=1 Tax=Lacihabitans sp. LS3-19 TaxID=2487335 RepID=UPI0020CCDCB9|nr:sigma-70 family RNA polymerase sigma factor [Lacihabitans sp. LS3-19]MCP9768902.1 sigma-70 family RNA polymerase sigma factor [Lacihabitans sp. LS3-19]
MFFKKNNKVFDLSAVIEGCRNDSPSSQKILFENFSKIAMRICSKYASNDVEAEEMIMDGFLKVFKNIKKYDSKYEFKGWFHRVMVNSAIDYFRKNNSRIEFSDIEMVENKNFDPHVIDILSIDEILDFVRRLSPVYRTVFSMAVIDGYEYSEIAEKLGVTESAVRGNLSKAKSRLQGWITEYLNNQANK